MCRPPCLTVMLLFADIAFTNHPVSAQDPQARNAWLYQVDGKKGYFQQQIGKDWLEETIDFSGQFRFQEVERTGRYVEIFDASRTMWLRLHADFCEWRQGEKPAWNRLYNGQWVASDSLPRRIPRDYCIRLAYFVPTDRDPTADYAKKIGVLMHFVSQVYRQDFESRGIRSKGLRFQSQNGQPQVHLIRGRRDAAFYNGAPNYDAHNQWRHILGEIPTEVGTPSRDVIIVFAETYDSGPAKFEWPGGVALGARYSAEGGVGLFSSWILRPEFCAASADEQAKLLFDETPVQGRIALGHGRLHSPRCEFIEDGFGAVAHELGHALGLPHDRRQDHLDIMGNGFRNLRWNFLKSPDAARRARFSDDNARILYTSRYLAADFAADDLEPPTVQLRCNSPLRAGATTIPVTLAATDQHALRAVLFFSSSQDCVVGGAALTGKSAKLDRTISVQPLQAGPFRIEAIVADAGGNLARAEFVGKVE